MFPVLLHYFYIRFLCTQKKQKANIPSVYELHIILLISSQVTEFISFKTGKFVYAYLIPAALILINSPELQGVTA
jgi:hypothetical protein